MKQAPTYHYRDFPELFWDAEPDAVIEPDNPFVLARVLQRGSIDHVRKLIDFDILRAHWNDLWIPARTRYVWQKILELPSSPPPPLR